MCAFDLQTAVDVVSLGAVIWALWLTRKDRREDRQLSAYAYWYQELLLAPNKEELWSTFSAIEKVAVDAASSSQPLLDEELRQAISRFSAEHRRLQAFVLRDAYLVNRELGELLAVILHQMQDDTLAGLEALTRSSGGGSSHLHESLRARREEFFAALYDFHQRPRRTST